MSAKEFFAKHPGLKTLLEYKQMRGNAERIIDEHIDQEIKLKLTEFLDFLLEEGYCDADVYAEPPTAIDQFLNKNQ